MARISMRGFTMSDKAFNEAEKAVNYMINQKVSIREVLRLPEFKTSRRSIKKYLKMRGMSSKTVSQYDNQGRFLGRYLLIIPNIEQRMYQFMMLVGTHSASQANRKVFDLQTKYRVLPRCFGVYNIAGEDRPVAEIEEIVVGNNTMPYEDYLEMRNLHLTVEIFNNDSIFLDLSNKLLSCDLDISFFSFSKFSFF